MNHQKREGRNPCSLLASLIGQLAPAMLIIETKHIGEGPLGGKTMNFVSAMPRLRQQVLLVKAKMSMKTINTVLINIYRVKKV